MHPECQPQNAGGRHQENSCNVQFCTLKYGCPWPKSALDSHFRAIACFVVLYELYQIYQQQIAECDTALTAHLQTLDVRVEPGSRPPTAKANKRAGGNAPPVLICGESYTASEARTRRKSSCHGLLLDRRDRRAHISQREQIMMLFALGSP